MSDRPRKRKHSESPSSPSQEYSAKRLRHASPIGETEVAPISKQKSDYTIGWICALPVEMAAASSMLDEKHDPLEDQDPQDGNSYRLGRIGKHNIVIACLPEYGTTPAATVAKDMLRTFTSIRIGLMVGIGAGVPSDNDNIRLGDVVISSSDRTYGGVVQWERGKLTDSGFERTGTLNKPPNVLRTALASLKAQHLEDGHRISDTIQAILEKKPHLREENFQHQGAENDKLYRPECLEHSESNKLCTPCRRAEELVARPLRSSLSPKIHYGTIASSNQVVKSGNEREKLRELYGAKCIEMEAAGLMDNFPCLVVRGICDYADSRKNKSWQPYAALTAAAYAKELLSIVQSQRLELTPCALADLESKIDILDSTTKKIEKGVKTTIDHMSKQDLRYQNEQHKRCHQALKTSAYQQFKNINPSRLDDTCQWALENPLYRQWDESPTSSLLWISADPGCGKSVLSRSLIDKELADNENYETVCYFFFKDNEEQNSLAIALCAVLHQLFEEQKHLLQWAIEAWDSNGNTIKHEVDQLWYIFTAAISDPKARKTVCVFDALDECRDIDRVRMIEGLSDLLQHTPSAGTHQSKIKFIVTSRPYDDIQQGFQNVPTTLCVFRLRGEQENDQLCVEIDRVIEVKVRSLATELCLQPSTVAYLRKTLFNMEHRTYLWLHLAIDDIRDTYRNSLRPDQEVIHSVPSSVDDAYEKILARVTKKQQQNVKTILRIIIGARRPLTISEMALALGIATSKDRKTLKDVGINETHLERQLRNWCGLFVFINVDMRIYLIHETAREFLLSRQEITATRILRHDHWVWKHCIIQEEVEGMMLTICTQCLKLEDCTGGLADSISTTAPVTTSGRKEFVNYCCEWWTDHLREADPTSVDTLLDEVLSLCNTKEEICDFWFTKFWETFWRETQSPYENVPDMTEVRLAALIGHEKILRHFLGRRDYDIDAKDKSGRTALYWASHLGYEKIAQMLLEHHADVNTQGGTHGSALQAASSKGYDRVVQILLDRGANVNIQDAEHSNALQAASYRGHDMIVQILLDQGADINAQGGLFGNALQAASYKNRDKIVRLLLSWGADVDAQGGFCGTALQAASNQGAERALQILFDRSANVNAQGGEFNNALQAALFGGNINIMQQLLQRGADVNAQGGLFGNVLQAASYGGDDEAVQMLLDQGAAVDAYGGLFGNALQAALSGGHSKVVKMLLDEGATARDMRYIEALQGSSTVHDNEIVQMLLNKGVTAQCVWDTDAFQGSPFTGRTIEGTKSRLAVHCSCRADVLFTTPHGFGEHLQHHHGLTLSEASVGAELYFSHRKACTSISLF